MANSQQPIRMSYIRDNLSLSGSVSLGQKEIRDLVGKPQGSVSMSEVYIAMILPKTPQECDYYFETFEEFETARNKMLTDHNNDLSNISIGFSDSVTSLERMWSTSYPSLPITHSPKVIFARNVTIVDRMFSTAKDLIEVSSTLLARCPKAKSFKYFFGNGTYYESPKVSTLPKGLFSYCTDAEDFSYAFYGSNIETIPEGLFENNHKIKTVKSCFYKCQDLTMIPDGLFENKVLLENAESCFGYDFQLRSLPNKLFKGCSSLKTISNCFNYNTNTDNEVTIPTDMFEGCYSLESAQDCFNSLNIIGVVSKNLFKDCQKLKDVFGMFRHCRSLNYQISSSGFSIEDGFFNNQTNLSIGYLCYNSNINKPFIMKEDGHGVLTILNDNETYTGVKGVSYMFSRTEKLRNVDIDIFKNCDVSSVTEIKEIFYNSQSLTSVKKGLFDKFNALTKCDGAFNNLSYYTGEIPDLWNNVKFPNIVSYKDYAKNTLNASNYAEIPSDWK